MYRRIFATSIVVLLVILALPAAAQNHSATYTASAKADQPYTIEYYYKAKWGHAEEFITLFEKNHLPLLRKEVELGRLLSISLTAPRYHTTEDGRWDYRVTLVFKNAAAANDDFDEAGISRQLWPDQATYKREEQRRFEILDSHWDLPIKNYEPARARPESRKVHP